MQQYGDTFVYGITTGGEFIGILQMETSSSDELTKIKAKVSGSASYGLISGSASAKFSQSLQEITSSYALKGTVMRRGGLGPLSNMTAEDLVNVAIKFPQDVSGDKGYPYSAIVIPYAHIPHPAGTPLFAAHQASVLDELGRIRERMLVFSNDLLVASERNNQFPGIDLHAVSNRYQQVNTELAKVMSAAKACYAQASECSLPNIDFSVLEPILPTQNEKLINLFEINFTCKMLDRSTADPSRLLTWSIRATEEVLQRVKYFDYTLLSWYEDKRRVPGQHYPYLEWTGNRQTNRATGFAYDFVMEPWRPRSVEIHAAFDTEVVDMIWFNPSPVTDGTIHSEGDCPFDRSNRQ